MAPVKVSIDPYMGPPPVRVVPASVDAIKACVNCGAESGVGAGRGAVEEPVKINKTFRSY